MVISYNLTHSVNILHSYNNIVTQIFAVVDYCIVVASFPETSN